MSHQDELPHAVVAAIAALLAAMQERDDEPEGAKVWARSGRVASNWSERGKHAWRDRERERGWH